ncbi:hypothetical protein L0F63_002147 [Massospora cicadina]|nr:hypothetical protein L0F63_002147 [Massospora cicadina]
MFGDSDPFMYDNDDGDFDFEDDTDEAIVLGNYTTADAMDDFEFIDTDRSKKKPYDVDFKILDVDQLGLLQKSEVGEVSSILGLPEELSRAFLRAYRWNKERASLEKLMDASSPPSFETQRDFTCPICCEDTPALKTLKLACGETFCLDCHKTFYEQKIVEGNARKILCVGSCGSLVQDEVLEKVVTPKMFEKFKSLQNNYFVDDNKTLKWCPAPDCVYVSQCDKCEDDSETANWIHANTKECPKCLSTIEKNGGCNHMTCRKCGNEFCWVCMGLWTHHGQAWYNCNRFEAKDSTDARDRQASSRASLERYLHYYNRYINHIQSAKLDQELYARTEEKMDEMQKTSDLSWIEVQFLKSAVDTLVQCRHTLKWTYALAFYLKRDNQTFIFESNQQDLELATEALSGLLEEPIEKESIPQLKQKVQDKANYVSQRRDILLTDLIKGHIEGRWNYTIQF